MPAVLGVVTSSALLSGQGGDADARAHQPIVDASRRSVAVAGLVVPFLVGVLAFTAIDFTRFEGTAQNRTALLLVFAIAIAVTSIR